ncbi:hypothetical protein AJ88_35205 [Mesorhizobium amorphae CCBAU 01583]|nr:hypothetical protein AJ88_35205 [Mesorhizobium amorphae CCBAU 01583]
MITRMRDGGRGFCEVAVCAANLDQFPGVGQTACSDTVVSGQCCREIIRRIASQVTAMPCPGLVAGAPNDVRRIIAGDIDRGTKGFQPRRKQI